MFFECILEVIFLVWFGRINNYSGNLFMRVGEKIVYICMFVMGGMGF